MINIQKTKRAGKNSIEFTGDIQEIIDHVDNTCPIHDLPDGSIKIYNEDGEYIVKVGQFVEFE